MTQLTAHEARTQFAMLTDIGQVRTHNEDACAADVDAGLYIVCDGMGGAAAGEVASQMASMVFLRQARQLGFNGSPTWRLQQAAKAANDAVFSESQRSPHLHGMGTTLVALELDPDAKTAWTVHVGDSRCYRMRDGLLQLLTEDHSYVDEQVRLGLMTPLEAHHSPLRHVITRAVGSHADVDADVTQHAVVAGDLFLLCSDGVTGELNDSDIATVLSSAGDDLQAAAQSLVNLANEFGGNDNLTVLLVRI